MNTSRALVAGILLFSTSLVQAAAPHAEITEDTAKRLIADVLDIRESGIRVANIVEGSSRTKDGFEYRDVRRVTAVLPRLTEKGLVRKSGCYDFFWSETYGWFHQEIRESRGGEEVWIWSEKLGEVVVR